MTLLLSSTLTVFYGYLAHWRGQTSHMPLLPSTTDRICTHIWSLRPLPANRAPSRRSSTPFPLSVSALAVSLMPLFLWPYNTYILLEYLAVGVVILISIALGAGVVFLLGLIGILWALFARRDDRSVGQDTIVEDDDSVRPSSLLAHVNAAARNTILGTPKNDYYGHKGEETVVGDHGRLSTANSHAGEIAAGAGAAGVVAAGDHNPLTPTTTMDEHDVNRPSHARYSFDGKGEGELPLNVGQEVTILNDQDPS